MDVQTQIPIRASRDTVWRLVTDFDNWEKTISAIEKVEILERPDEGLLGLKWRETRKMFGKEATEVMWITDAVEGESYQTRAESHGSIYISKVYVTDDGDHTVLHMDFGATPRSLGAKMISAMMGFMMKGSLKKAMQTDLEDIRAAAEGAVAIPGR